MTLELWLECHCNETSYGDELVAVGNHPALGDWCVEKGVVLHTSAASFPRWTFQRPIQLADTKLPLPLWVEYKYVIRSPHGHKWEDLGLRSVLPTSSSTAAASANSQFEDRPAQAMNRRVPNCRSKRLPERGVVLRLDRLGQLAAEAEASWLVGPNWGPGIAGQESVLASICFTLNDDVRIASSSLTLVASRIFVQPRQNRLLCSLMQLRRGPGHTLPTVVWSRIGEFVGGS